MGCSFRTRGSGHWRTRHNPRCSGRRRKEVDGGELGAWPPCTTCRLMRAKRRLELEQPRLRTAGRQVWCCRPDSSRLGVGHPSRVVVQLTRLREISSRPLARAAEHRSWPACASLPGTTITTHTALRPQSSPASRQSPVMHKHDGADPALLLATSLST